mgnify:CR=1 FL=1
MSDEDYKGLANILRINPPKKKAPVLTKEELEFEEEMNFLLHQNKIYGQ